MQREAGEREENGKLETDNTVRVVIERSFPLMVMNRKLE